MTRKQNKEYDLTRDHGQSEIVNKQIALSSKEVHKGEIAGFPWQLVVLIVVIALGVLGIALKVSGLY